jgi:pimeloyl-ACP methyl ester carboxylesterase
MLRIASRGGRVIRASKSSCQPKQAVRECDSEVRVPFLSVNGIRLRYEAWGVGSTPLALLHGLGSSADDWFMQLPAFAPHYRCIAVDLRGHGLSDKPPGPYAMPLFASDVARLLEIIGAAPAHVLGLSLGGMVAQALATTHPKRVRSLVLLNTLPGLWPPTREVVRLGMRRLSAPWRRRPMPVQARRIAADLFPHPETALLRQHTEHRLAGNDPAAYQAAMAAVVRYRPGKMLSRVTCPVLIVAGSADRVVPAIFQARLRRALPHAEFVSIPGGGHACNIEMPEAVNTEVLRFLLRQDSESHHTSGMNNQLRNR